MNKEFLDKFYAAAKIPGLLSNSSKLIDTLILRAQFTT